jgi:hypothetical protein
MPCVDDSGKPISGGKREFIFAFFPTLPSLARRLIISLVELDLKPHFHDELTSFQSCTRNQAAEVERGI